MKTPEASDGSEIGYRQPVRQKAEYLRDLINKSAARIRIKRNQNRFWAWLLRASTLIGSTLVTIFLGLQVSSSATHLKQAAFVIGATVTLLSAVEPFFNFRSLWVEQDEALADIYQLQEDFGFYMAGADELDIERLEQFGDRHRETWGRLSKKWLQFRRSSTPVAVAARHTDVSAT